jgi:urea transporter
VRVSVGVCTTVVVVVAVASLPAMCEPWKCRPVTLTQVAGLWRTVPLLRTAAALSIAERLGCTALPHAHSEEAGRQGAVQYLLLPVGIECV